MSVVKSVVLFSSAVQAEQNYATVLNVLAYDEFDESEFDFFGIREDPRLDSSIQSHIDFSSLGNSFLKVGYPESRLYSYPLAGEDRYTKELNLLTHDLGIEMSLFEACHDEGFEDERSNFIRLNQEAFLYKTKQESHSEMRFSLDMLRGLLFDGDNDLPFDIFDDDHYFYDDDNPVYDDDDLVYDDDDLVHDDDDLAYGNVEFDDYVDSVKVY